MGRTRAASTRFIVNAGQDSEPVSDGREIPHLPMAGGPGTGSLPYSIGRKPGWPQRNRSQLWAVNRNGRTSTFRLQALDPSAARVSATSPSGASMIQKPATYSSDSTNGPSVIRRLVPPVVDHGRRGGRLDAGGQDPVAHGLESLIEGVDGDLLLGGCRAGPVIDYREEIAHLIDPFRGEPPPKYRRDFIDHRC